MSFSDFSHRCPSLVPGLGLAVLLLNACGASPPDSEAPHLILLSIDTLRADAVRPWNPDAPPRPHLDALAADAAYFEDALAPASWTLPSHASLMTGLYPHHHGAAHPDHRLPSELITLAEVLAQAGWDTAAFTDQGFVDHRYGFDQGFQRYDEKCAETAKTSPTCRETAPRPVAQAGPSKIFSRARSFLVGQPPEQPLFLFLHSYWAHNYFLFDEPLAIPGGSTLDSQRARRCMVDLAVCSADEWKVLQELYDRRIDELDGAIGALRQALATDLSDRPTYLVLVSDHGEGFDQPAARIHHGGRLHGDQLRVPLLITGAGIPAGPRSQPVSLVDVAPTLLDLAGLDPEQLGRPDERPDGRSLTPTLESPESPPRSRRRLAFEHANRWRDGRKIQVGEGFSPLEVAVVAHPYWYISDGEAAHLYDRLDQPQKDDLMTESPPVEIVRSLDHTAGSLLRTRSSTATADTDRELEEQLRALGYVN